MLRFLYSKIKGSKFPGDSMYFSMFRVVCEGVNSLES